MEKLRYVHGSTVRKNNRDEECIEDNPFIRSRQITQMKKARVRKNKTKDAIVCLIALVVAIGIGFLCIQYLRYNVQYNEYQKQVSAKELYLTQLKEENSAMSTKLNVPVDLGMIREVAVEEYGMVEATKEQVMYYSDSNVLKVEQYGDIPTNEDTEVDVLAFIKFGR